MLGIQRIYPGAHAPTPSALSMLYHLCHEPLGHRLPMYNVSCHSVYVLILQEVSFVDIAHTALGTAFLIKSLLPGPPTATATHLGVAYLSISPSVNILLTLMIVTRLFLHSRGIRDVMGTFSRVSGLYTTIVTILVESCTLYAVCHILYLGGWAASSPLANLFFLVLTQVQVRAVLLPPVPPQSRRFYLIATPRLSPRSSSSYELPTAVH
jgi:hypothetical protein